MIDNAKLRAIPSESEIWNSLKSKEHAQGESSGDGRPHDRNHNASLGHDERLNNRGLPILLQNEKDAALL